MQGKRHLATDLHRLNADVKNERKKEEKEIHRKGAKSVPQIKGAEYKKENYIKYKKTEDTNCTICYSTSPYIIK